ncbi:porin gram-negative type (plasmid) [Cupriavidus necator N-1]|uniref:Porin gram-negative type n=1 Tax=Cupriavidus necator (strain ATCC 43291 / DSM 13513 / CCUG 52238 / LMG 8453 / N-1) TaxID=1042878 RepID=F8GYY1_CUPNN|nr:porin [Cupriavidus necator]AEI83072.1 porin gram-negative type [Cupriavidus necator N-1]MDX6008483.1 porin [Cupriavidus necator]
MKHNARIVLAHACAVSALASLAPAAHAQSSVTLYGVADTFLEYNNHQRAPAGTASSGGSLVRLNSGGLAGSRWGLRGTEDLGGGMQAIFALESGFNLDTGTMGEAGRLFNRQAFLGVSTKDFGRLTFGRQYTSMFDLLPVFMPLVYAGAYEPMPFLMSPLRIDNAVKYRVDRGPFAAQAHYGFGEQAGSWQGDAAWGGGVSYTSGELGLAAVYDQVNGRDTATGYGRMRKVAVAGTYAPGDWRFTTGYRWAQDTMPTGVTRQRDDMWWAGVGYRVTPFFQVNAAFYYDRMKVREGQANPPNPKQYVLQGIYAASKRTDLYAAVAYARDAGLNFAALSTLAAGARSQTGAAVGIRHKF